MSPSQQTYYFDHAAATPLSHAVAQVVRPLREEAFVNPSSIYLTARGIDAQLETARAQIANILGAKPTEVIFTSGATEANNLAIQGVLRAYAPHSASPIHWITSSIEHDAIGAQCAALRRQGFDSSVIAVDHNGIVDAHSLAAKISDSTVLISVMLANNELGTIQPLREISQIVQTVREHRRLSGNRLPLYVHTDAAQAGNYLDVGVERLGVDLMTLNAAKIYGPKGAGVLYVRNGIELEPLFWGGNQERGRRSGTVDVAGAVGMAQALIETQVMRRSESRRLEALRDTLQKRIIATIPNSLVNGGSHRLPNFLNLTFPGAEGQAIVMYLDNVGIMAATGSACSSNSLDPSHVLTAIGRSREEARCSLRLSLGRATDKAALEAVSLHLPAIVERLRAINIQ